MELELKWIEMGIKMAISANVFDSWPELELESESKWN